MKNLVILLLIIGGGYFAYSAFNSSDTINQQSARDQVAQQQGLEDLAGEVPVGGQGALIDINNQIKDSIQNAKDTVEKASVTTNDFIEAGIADLAEESKDSNSAAASAGVYMDYDNTNLSSIDGKIVLDFYASWCPSCRKLEKDIKASLLDIPAGVTILKVNYDKEKELKQKYGVTQQHTLVQVDQSGNMIEKWSGGNTLESIISKLK